MDYLPLELKQLIVKEVSVIDNISQEALRALAQVNRQWNRVAGSHIYRHLTIHLESSILEPLQRVLQLLDLSHILPHIQRLTLVCQEIPLKRDSPAELGRYLDQTPAEDIIPPRNLGGYKGDWTPVVRLVEQLHGLQQLDLLMFRHYPLKLLDTLAVTHPHCRLSIVAQNRRDAGGILATRWIHSPVLHTIQIVHPEDHCVPFVEHPDRALRDILRQVPYIKRLSLQLRPGRGSASRTYHDYHRWLRSQPAESGMHPASRACLEVLALPLSTTMTREGLEAWSGVVNWQSLTAWAPGTIEDSTVLSTIAIQQPFQALQRLTLFLRPPEGVDYWANWTHAAQRMFDALPPLVYLCLLGPYEQTLLLTVLDRHGPTLTELQLDRDQPQYQSGLTFSRLARNGPIAPIFTAEVIAGAATRCPVLRTLRICVQRHRGHPLEVAAYDALGQFSALQTLDLILICLPAVVMADRPASALTPFPPRALTALEQELLDGHCPKWIVRDQAINAAIDELLATAIFKRIQGGQATAGRGRLKLLRLHPRVGRLAHYHDDRSVGGFRPLVLGRSHDLYKEMAGAWQVQCNNSSGVGMVRAENQYRPTPCPRTMRSAELEIFESIWPSNDGQTNRIWPLAWQSWPLQ
ncbi:hypothetical protein BO99DRAFT_388967 [Aspergillus violaceofuscus CBS 115571]|uniref:F-box domain-containing protein n=1 Tax=Aspergillus violaceofuscus (strain CBS 115571) TaxID=1450538 RepID=A0A2V5HZW1_ASPV1|nr:hypothetical protein BO99DRAFT_388967 [Aspergillus violaceofuscus CBS 115571]